MIKVKSEFLFWQKITINISRRTGAVSLRSASVFALGTLCLFWCFFLASALSAGGHIRCRKARKLDGSLPWWREKHLRQVAALMYTFVGCWQKLNGLNEAPSDSGSTTDPKCSMRSPDVKVQFGGKNFPKVIVRCRVFPPMRDVTTP